uniref:Uncharacterized protein n=1 Tax=Romanomermis culicivorax TaxID=13658 RepID=A0A915HK63_ROMCU
MIDKSRGGITQRLAMRPKLCVIETGFFLRKQTSAKEYFCKFSLKMPGNRSVGNGSESDGLPYTKCSEQMKQRSSSRGNQ